MHLNLFLPALERSQRGTADEPPGAILRAARALLPSALFSDPRSGRPGLLRRILKALGPNWLAAPLRRLTQTVCLLLFFVLLLYVVGAHGCSFSFLAPGGSVLGGTASSVSLTISSLPARVLISFQTHAENP